MHCRYGLWGISEHRGRPQRVGQIEAASCQFSREAAVENERAGGRVRYQWDSSGE
jgi:hypothetical protein